MSSDNPVHADPVPVAGGVLVSGTTVHLAGELHPALHFTFRAPHGGSYAPMTLVVGEPQLEELPTLLVSAIDHARQAAHLTDRTPT